MAPESGLVLPRVLLVTDPAYDDARVERVVAEAGAALGGALGVLVRDRVRARKDVVRFALALRKVAAATGSRLVVHSDVALAREAGADGVHFSSAALGEAESGARLFDDARTGACGAWISVATHTDAEVVRAAEARADAVLVSPIYATPGKGSPRGPRAVAAACAAAPGLVVYALGGVDEGRATACARAGAHGVAVIRALLAAPDPRAAALAVVAALRPEDGLR